jgi:Periplasmic binding protein
VSRTLRGAIAALLILILVASACGNSGDDDDAADDGGSDGPAEPSGEEERDTFVEISGVPGVTDEEISYAAIGTRSGNPLGTCILDCYLEGIEAYFAYRNSEGGIYGRNLVLAEDIDDALGNNQATSLEVASSDDYFGAFQATLAATGWGDLNDAGVPTYTWGIHAAEAANRDHVFPSAVIRCGDCTGRAIPYTASLAGKSTIAALGYGVTENSKACAGTIQTSVELYGDDTGTEIGYFNDELAFGLGGGVGPEVTAMKQAGVDFIATCIDLNGMKTLAEELQRQDMDDVVLYHPNTYNHAFVEENADLFEGDYVSIGFRPFEAESDGTALADYLQWMEEIGAEPTELAMAGWVNATLAFDGLLAAGPEFDRDKVVAATNAMTDFTAGGLIPSVDWGAAHQPFTNDTRPDGSDSACNALLLVVDGVFETVADPTTPWFCYPPGIEWAEPEETNFE